MSDQTTGTLAEIRDLSDADLNEVIERALTITALADTTLIEQEMLGMAASQEWRRRHPSTVPPATFLRAIEQGGFPSCYTGPRATVDLESGQGVYAAMFGPNALN